MGYTLKLSYVTLIVRGFTEHHGTKIVIFNQAAKMKYKKFVRYYSYSRISKYYKATKHSKAKAMMLYYGNLKIAQAFHPLLGVLEVILRNRLHSELAKHFDDGNWIINQQSGFMKSPLLIKKNKRTGITLTNDYLFREVSKAEQKLKNKGVNITAGRIIAEQTLGFWISFFDLIHYKILKGVPIQAFQKLPAGYGRKEVYEALNKIRDFRNRINHNESICFVGRRLDFSYAKEIYQTITQILNWIDPDIQSSLYEIDRVLKVIEKEENKQQ